MLPPRLLPLRYFSPSWRVIQIRQASGTNGTPPKRHPPRRHRDNSQPSTKPSDSITSPENDAISHDISQSETSLTNSDVDFVSPSRETQVGEAGTYPNVQQKVRKVPFIRKWLPPNHPRFSSRPVQPRSTTSEKNGAHDSPAKDESRVSQHNSRNRIVSEQLWDSNEISGGNTIKEIRSTRVRNKTVIPEANLKAKPDAKQDVNPEAGGSRNKTIIYRAVRNKDVSLPLAQSLPIEEPPQPSDSILRKEEEPKRILNSDNSSLLEELFPEIVKKEPSTTQKPSERIVPKLDLPDLPRPIVSLPARRKSMRERFTEAFISRGEDITVLKLQHCSTALAEADFRRLIRQGKHIEGWVQDGDIAQVIPGRDPVSLARRPFYWLLFSTHDAAVAYQVNASRIHHLAARHTPRSVFSAVPPPPGVLENGEDLHALIQSYTLYPPSLKLPLNMVLQPYEPLLRAVVEQGGYRPIVDDREEKLHKVLLWIEGQEPHPFTLYNSIQKDGAEKGLIWGIAGAQKGIKRLADLTDIQKFSRPSSEPDKQTEIRQEIIDRVYNRWIIEFETERMAKRFARAWHRRRLPIAGDKGDWKDDFKVRMCNTEVLW
jgi:hypothetical protein